MLLSDATGDGTWDLAPVVTSPALDVVSGDIATGPKTLVAVLRLGSTDFSVTNDHWARSGYSWTFGATSSLGQSYLFSALLNLDGTLSSKATVDAQPVPVEFKVVGNTFQWTMQRKSSPNLSRPKNVFRAFRGGSEVESSTADSAFTKESAYPDRANSCVSAK